MKCTCDFIVSFVYFGKVALAQLIVEVEDVVLDLLECALLSTIAAPVQPYILPRTPFLTYH